MNFKELQEKVAATQLGNAKLTDIKDGSYNLQLPAKDGDPIYLINDKKAKYPITLRGLAAMRVVTDASKITVKTTREARDIPEVFGTLQKSIVEDNMPISDSTKFNVVGHLRIHDVVSDALVYKNEHYTNYPEYVKTTRKVAALPKITEAEQTLRNNLFTEATEALRAGGVNKGAKAPKDVDESYILMPVFTVTN